MRRNEGLWGEVMKEKYITLGSMENLIRNEGKDFGGASIIKNTLVKSSIFLKEWLAQNIGKKENGWPRRLGKRKMVDLEDWERRQSENWGGPMDGL